MENLNLDNFNPKIAELTELKDKYNALKINGIDDKEGYKAVDLARKELKSTRVQIAKDGKLLRDGAVKFQKAVIEKEKELIGIIKPAEEELEKKQKEIDKKKKIEARREALPKRKERLQGFEYVDIKITDNEILAMEGTEFDSLVLRYKEEELNIKEQKIKEAENKVRQEKEEKERIQQIKKNELANSRKQELYKVQADIPANIGVLSNEEFEKVLTQAKINKEALEKEKIEKIRQEEQEKARKEKEELLRQQEKKKKEKEQAEKEAIEKMEKAKAYTEFRKNLGYTEATKGEFKEVNNNGVVTIYRKVGEFKL